MDLQTGTEMAIEMRYHDVDPRNQEQIDAMFESITLPYYLTSGERALLSTVDVVRIPAGVIGLIQLRSTWARLGLLSPPTVADPGFEGTLTLEVYNGSQHNILISPDDAIWSLHLVLLVPESEPDYTGRYQGQTRLQLPKALP